MFRSSLLGNHLCSSRQWGSLPRSFRVIGRTRMMSIGPDPKKPEVVASLRPQKRVLIQKEPELTYDGPYEAYRSDRRWVMRGFTAVNFLQFCIWIPMIGWVFFSPDVIPYEAQIPYSIPLMGLTMAVGFSVLITGRRLPNAVCVLISKS